MEYNPFLSVTVPIFVFSQYTFAPIIGLNLSEEIRSRTFPFMFCDSADPDTPYYYLNANNQITNLDL